MKNPRTRTGLWHPPKGSPEARAHMARLRAMRGKNPKLRDVKKGKANPQMNPLTSGERKMILAGADYDEAIGRSWGEEGNKVQAAGYYGQAIKARQIADRYAANPPLLVLGNPLEQKEASEILTSAVTLVQQAQGTVDIRERHRLLGMAYQSALLAHTYGPRRPAYQRAVERDAKAIVNGIRAVMASEGVPSSQLPPAIGNGKNPGRRGAPLALGRTWTEEKHKPKGAFDPGSFRYKRIPAKGPLKAYLLLGCPKGYWHPVSQRCEIAQELHVMMRPGRRAGAAPRPPRAAANPGHCPPGVPPGLWADPAFQAELRAYRKRHGRGPVEIRRIKVPKGFPKFLSVYGTADHAVYDAPRHSVKGKRIHHFGKRGKHKPWLVSSAEAGPKFLAFVGGTFKARPEWVYD